MAFPPKPEASIEDSRSLICYAQQLGFIAKHSLVREVDRKHEEAFMTAVMKLGLNEEAHRRGVMAEEMSEHKLALQYGYLDVGQNDDTDDDSGRDDPLAGLSNRVVTPEASTRHPSAAPDGPADTTIASGGGPSVVTGGCFKDMCDILNVAVGSGVRSVSELEQHDMVQLSRSSDAFIGCIVYGNDDPRNHVVAVRKFGKSGTLPFTPLDPALSSKTVSYSLTNPQEFFNVGGRFFSTKFYAEQGESGQVQDMSDVLPEDVTDTRPTGQFGGDISTRADPLNYSRDPDSLMHSVRAERSSKGDSAPRASSGFGANVYRPPASIVDESEHAGSNNTTGGVVRAKRRVVKGMNTFEDGYRVRRNYQVAATTLFNNVDELYLNVISKDYVQEIIEELFTQWALPTDQPETMRYAEDLLHAFLIARTASNKANYNSEFEVPTKQGEITVSFSVFSLLLTDKYGLTRRNFARGIADDLRGYLNRPENQAVKSRSAQRVGADPQYGDLCFDGSTGCTGVTSSEMTFCRLLEGRNLYERDDVVAEGASDKLMQGIHGGVRSIVQR